jgi:uncharacterized membrane protein YvbJ
VGLITCADCGNSISDSAPQCPHCGRPIATAQSAPTKLDKTGAWCPNCHNRDSYKSTSGVGCVFWIFVLVSMGLALLMIPFLPKTWRCRVCKHEWRA